MLAIMSVQRTHAIIDGRLVPSSEVLNSFVHFSSARSGRGFVCGGVLITWRHVLTAAHCGVEAGHYYAHFGTNRLHDSDAVLVASVDTVETHRKYGADENYNPDLSVVTLSGVTRINMKRLGIFPIDINFEVLPLSTELELMGFGCHQHYTDIRVRCEPSSRLRAATLFKISNQYCPADASKDPTKSLCLDGSSRGTACAGDSGGPILRRVRTHGGREDFELVGVIVRVSGSTKCQRGEKVLGVAVGRYRNWLIRRTGVYRRW